jgi:PAS domain S-box-containing protein
MRLTAGSTTPAPPSNGSAASDCSVRSMNSEILPLARRSSAAWSSSRRCLASPVRHRGQNLGRRHHELESGAQRLFGYTADEAIGKSIMILIPAELRHEELTIIGRIRRGERTEPYETVRRRKDGSLVDISLTVSPVKNSQDEIIGASKIARDVTGCKRAEEQLRLLPREMDHRVKNLFTLASGVVALSARTASTPQEMSSSVRDRLTALARAHALTLPR